MKRLLTVAIALAGTLALAGCRSSARASTSSTTTVVSEASSSTGNGTIVVSTNPDTYKAGSNSTEIYASESRTTGTTPAPAKKN